MQRLFITTALLDSAGKVLTAKESTVDLNLTDPTYQHMLTSGLSLAANFEAPAGAVQLREVVEESVEGRMACSSRPLPADSESGETPPPA